MHEDATADDLVPRDEAHVDGTRRQHGPGDVGPVPPQQLLLAGGRLLRQRSRPTNGSRAKCMATLRRAIDILVSGPEGATH